MKLVRDNLPNMGGRDYISIVDDYLHRKLLAAKLVEEAIEFFESVNDGCTYGDAEEMADVQQVLDDIYNAFKFTAPEIDNIQGKKAAEKGRFGRKAILTGLDPKGHV